MLTTRAQQYIAEMGDRFATIDMGRGLRTQVSVPASVNPEPYLGDCCALSMGEMGPHLTQCGLGRGLNSSVPSGILVHTAVCHNTWAEKWGLLCPFFGRRARSPSNTMSVTVLFNVYKLLELVVTLNLFVLTSFYMQMTSCC